MSSAPSSPPIAPRALAAAIATTLLALQEAFAQGLDDEDMQVEDAYRALAAALNALRDRR